MVEIGLKKFIEADKIAYEFIKIDSVIESQCKLR